MAAKSNAPEWVDRAEQDHTTVVVLQKISPPLWEIISFHCQQVAEKYLKAFLIEQGWALQKTHNLSALLAEAERHDPTLSTLRQACLELTPFIASGRYPGRPVTQSEGEAAVANAGHVRATMRKRMQLP